VVGLERRHAQRLDEAPAVGTMEVALHGAERAVREQKPRVDGEGLRAVKALGKEAPPGRIADDAGRHFARRPDAEDRSVGGCAIKKKTGIGGVAIIPKPEAPGRQLCAVEGGAAMGGGDPPGVGDDIPGMFCKP
jgi:hypothetical protein